MNDLDALVTTDHPEVARLLGYSNLKHPHLVIRRLAREKKIPALKDGGVFKFHIPTLKGWIAAQFAATAEGRK